MQIDGRVPDPTDNSDTKDIYIYIRGRLTFDRYLLDVRVATKCR